MEQKLLSNGLKISYDGQGKPLQISWKSPELRDDNNKIRCPEGFTSLRLWVNGSSLTLSQGIKALLGGGDIPIVQNIKKDILQKLCSSGEDEILSTLFELKNNNCLENAWGRKL